MVRIINMRKIREFWIDTNDTNRFSCWDIYGMPQNIKGEFLVREVTETGGITDKSVDEMAHEFVNECPKYSGYPAHMETFKAGHASRQPEIATLTAKVKRYEEVLTNIASGAWDWEDKDLTPEGKARSALNKERDIK